MGNNKSATGKDSKNNNNKSKDHNNNKDNNNNNKDNKDSEESSRSNLSLEELYTLIWAKTVKEKLDWYRMSCLCKFRNTTLVLKDKTTLKIKEITFDFSYSRFMFMINNFHEDEDYFYKNRPHFFYCSTIVSIRPILYSSKFAVTNDGKLYECSVIFDIVGDGERSIILLRPQI